MRPLLLLRIVFALAIGVSYSVAQSTSTQPATPQTARQALIEMLFGDAPDHLEKHLPDITRRTFEKLRSAGGQSSLAEFTLLAKQAKSGPEKLETFDTGPTFLTIKGSAFSNYEKIELTVERDDLAGDDDQIELAAHIFSDGKEETLLPLVLRFNFSMKLESGVWRLNEPGAAVHFPFSDPAFLKAMEEHQLRQNEQMALLSVRSVVFAEKSYQSAQGSFACTLSALTGAAKETGGRKRAYLYDSQLASGKKNGYTFAISECDPSHYRIAAEPAAPDSSQRAYCSDESGTIRSSADGKATTCMASGEVVPEKIPPTAMSRTNPTAPGNSGSGTPGRVRVSMGVAAGLIVTKVPPVYPPSARDARIQGTVIMKAVISATGDVESVELVSGHPLLAPAAIEAVKQWKYRPYRLNGNPVAMETQVQVIFRLSEQ